MPSWKARAALTFNSETEKIKTWQTQQAVHPQHTIRLSLFSTSRKSLIKCKMIMLIFCLLCIVWTRSRLSRLKDKMVWKLKIRRFLHLVECLISTTQGKRVCQRISPALKIDLASEWALIWSHLRSWCTVLGPCGPTLVAFTLAGTQHQMGGL